MLRELAGCCMMDGTASVQREKSRKEGCKGKTLFSLCYHRREFMCAPSGHFQKLACEQLGRLVAAGHASLIADSYSSGLPEAAVASFIGLRGDLELLLRERSP